MFSTLNKFNEFGRIIDAISSNNVSNENIVNYLPTNPYVFAHINGKPGEILSLIKKVVPSTKLKIESFFKAIDKFLELDFNKLFFNQIGKRMGISIYDFDPNIFLLDINVILNMNFIAYIEITNSINSGKIIKNFIKNAKKINPGATYSIISLNGVNFYSVKLKKMMLIGIFNNYILIGTNKTTIENVIKSMTARKQTGFLKSLQAKNFTERLNKGAGLNFFINLQKVFKNSIITPLVRANGILLDNLKNFYISSGYYDGAISTTISLFFK